MNKLLLFIGMTLIFSGAFAQNETAVFDEIALIIKAQNQQELQKYLAPRVEITIDKEQQECAKLKALDILSKFLKQFEVNSYDIKHVSEVGKDGLYAISHLDTKTESYKSNIFLTKIGEQFYIREINFEHEVSSSNK